MSLFVERALIAWLAGQCTGGDTAMDTVMDTGVGTGAGVIPGLVSRIEAIEATLAALPPIVSSSALGIPRAEATPTPAPKQPAQNRRGGASSRPPESGGLSVGAALIAAKAEVTEGHAMGSNRDQRMLSRYGVKAAPWLQEQGWERRGWKWYPPVGG